MAAAAIHRQLPQRHMPAAAFDRRHGPARAPAFLPDNMRRAREKGAVAIDIQLGSARTILAAKPQGTG